MAEQIVSFWRSYDSGTNEQVGWRLMYDGVYHVQTRRLVTDWASVAADVALVEFIRRECFNVGFPFPPPPEPPPPPPPPAPPAEEDFR